MFVSLFKKIGIKLSLSDPEWGRGSKNSNQDGKKPNDGPPEIEEIWRDITQNLSRFFRQGRKGGGNDGGDSDIDTSGVLIGLAIVCVVLLFLWLVSGFFIVQEGQKGVITTFGKYSNTVNSGMSYRWPYPFQSIEIVDVSKLRTIEVGYRGSVRTKDLRESLMLTDDENIVDIQFVVQYKLSNPVDWLFNNRDAEESIRQVAETSVREVVGRSKMDFVLYEGRAQVALDVSALMQKILDRYQSGVYVMNVTMQAVQPPEQVQTAFDDAVKAGQDKIRQKNEGQAYANNIIPKATGEASRIIQEAEADKSQVVAVAEGNASRFKQVLVEYQKAPQVTRDRLYLEAMQQIFSSTSKVLTDAKGGSNILYLPLDKMMQINEINSQRSAPVASNSASSEQIPTVEMHYNKDSRSRDSRDSRDREAR